MSSKINFILQFLTFGFLFFLVSCGGGGGGGSVPQKDTSPPVILNQTPDNLGIDVSIIEPIVITFNEAIDTATENNVALFKYQSSTPNNFNEALQATDRVSVNVTVDKSKLIISPNPGSVSGFVPFTSEARYKLTLIGIQDKAGNQLANTTWEFATTTIPGGSIQPTMNEAVSRVAEITISFTEAMDVNSLKTGFTLEELGATSGGSLPTLEMTYLNNTAVYSLPVTSPATYFNPNSRYKFTLAGAKDVKGNSVVADLTTEFTTNDSIINNVLTTKPENVIATTNSTGIDVSWDAAPAINGSTQNITYNLYVSTDELTYTSVVKNLSVLTYSDTNGINNNVAYRYAVTANASGLESLKAFSDRVTPVQIANLPAITSFLIDDNDPNTIPSENITILEGQSVALKLTMKFINGSGVITSSDTNAQLNIAAGTTDATLISFTANIPTPTVTTTYSLTVTKGKSVATKIVTVTIRKIAILSFKQATSSVSETVVTTDIIVTRSGGCDGVVKVKYKTNAGGTATAGSDYDAIPKLTTPPSPLPELIFDQGCTDKVISVAITNDNLTKNDPGESLTENFSLTLSSPSNGANLGNNINHVVTINDNDILALNFGLKKLQFSWTSFPGTTFYRLYENIMGTGSKQVGNDISSNTLSKTIDITVHNYDWINTIYRLEACNTLRCITTNSVVTLDQTLKTIGYFKESNTDPRDFFGASVSLSDDGLTLAVGANGESSKEPGIINFNDATAFPITTTDDDTLVGSGAVYIFTRSPAGSWKQQAYIKASNPGASDWFGFSISLSGDGLTLAVGAPAEASNVKRPATTGNGIAFPTPLLDDNTAKGGAVYVYKNTSGRWAQEAYLKKLSASLGDNFGNSVSLSRDGSTLAIGFPDSDQVTLGLPTIVDIGGVNIFNRINGIWNSTPYYEIGRNSTEYHYFGQSVALSGDGNTLAVGATGEASNKTGVTNVGFPPSDKVAANFSGAVYVYDRLKPGNSWAYSAYIKANNASANDYFGISIDLSDDGGILAVGASGEGSNQLKLVNSSSAPLNDTTAANNTGAVYTFAHSIKGGWVQQAYIKASNAEAYNVFGYKVALSGNGKILAVGASGEWSNTSGLINNATNFPTPSTDDDSAADAGAVYLFTNTSGNWAQQSYIKSSNTDATDYFGYSIALSGKKLPDGTIVHDGSTLAVGAYGEDGNNTGVMNTNITPDITNLFDRAGAVYLY